MAGGEECDHFIAQLAIAHAAAGVRVLRLHHAGQQIATGQRIAAPLRDNAVDQPIELGDSSFHATVPRRRHPFGNRRQIAEPVDEILHQNVDGRADAFEVDGHVDVHHCLGDDRER